MKYLLIGILIMGMFSACSDSEEGLIGEWEGIADKVNSDGELFKSKVSCTIRSIEGVSRGLILKVGGVEIEFNGIEKVNEIIYTESPFLNDTVGMYFITGSATLQNDTLLHFEHMIYETINGALGENYKEEFDMVRK